MSIMVRVMVTATILPHTKNGNIYLWEVGECNE